jgi:RimJ/RimL family protein N-acetyltransferase
MPTIYTPRLELRPVTADLAAAIIAGDTSTLTTGDGWPHEDTLDGLGGVAHGADAWLVTLDGVVIGDCGTHGPVDPDGDIELGYGLAVPYRGRGFGNEIAAGLTGHLRGLPGVRRVVANEVLADNIPSRRALENAGFRCVRETDDLCWYALDVTAS